MSGDVTTVTEPVAFYDALWTRTRRLDQHHKCRMLAIESALRQARLDGRLRILEPGCGSGLVSALLARHGEVTGIDQSPIGIEKARQRVPGRFLVGTLPALPPLPSDFDLCVLSQVVEHFSDSDRLELLQGVRRRVRPGGCLIVTTPNRPVSSRMRSAPGELEPIENWMDPAALRALLAETGWRVVATRFAFNFFPVLASKHRLVRGLRYLVYDVLRLRNAIERLTASWGVGDCTVILAVKP